MDFTKKDHTKRIEPYTLNYERFKFENKQKWYKGIMSEAIRQCRWGLNATLFLATFRVHQWRVHFFSIIILIIIIFKSINQTIHWSINQSIVWSLKGISQKVHSVCYFVCVQPCPNTLDCPGWNIHSIEWTKKIRTKGQINLLAEKKINWYLTLVTKKCNIP